MLFLRYEKYKTAHLLLSTENKNPTNSKGLTIIELIIVVVIIALILTPTITILKNTLNLMWHVESSFSLGGDIRSMIQLIVKDIETSSRASLGSVIYNGGFERSSDGFYPDGWAKFGGSNFAYIEGGNDSEVHGGECSISVNRNIYKSDVVTLSSQTAYMVTGWVRLSGTPPFNINHYFGLSVLGLPSSQWPYIRVSSGTWTYISIRYPGTGVLSTNQQGNVFARSNWINQSLFVDEVSVTPLKAVLATDDPAEQVNISEYMFEKNENRTWVRYRYRIENGAFLRERFNNTISAWETTVFPKITNVKRFVFEYPNNPVQGKDTLVKLSIRMSKSVIGSDREIVLEWTGEFYPLIP